MTLSQKQTPSLNAPSLPWCLLLLLWVAAISAPAQTVTNTTFFNGLIVLDGDISDFFLIDGLTPKPGVCVVDDPNGLDGSPLSETSTLDALKHPSGFNQRRILSAYNPNANGGTLYIGIDLPGGSGADTSSKMTHSLPGNPNPNYFDGKFGADLGGNGFGRGKIVPFDGDANGEPDSIGRTLSGGILARCSDYSAGHILDSLTCFDGSDGFNDDPRIELGAKETYVANVTFKNNQRVTVEIYQDSLSPPGFAQVSVTSSPNAPFGARVSTDSGNDGVVLGFDLEFAITNVNAAVANVCARLSHTVVVRSSSNVQGSAQGGDYNQAICVYNLPKGLIMTKQCPATNAAPGSLLVFTGSVQNTGQLNIVNLTIVNDQPVPNTIVLANIMLAAGETRGFTNSYLVPVGYTNCSITDTLTATGLVCSAAVAAVASATCPISCSPGQAVTNATSFFTGTIALDGDISDFFLPDGLTPKPGVCFVNDLNGLDEAALGTGSTLDGLRHPSGFNQRRIMTAFNPNVSGGTIYVGMDLPGGTGADSSSKTIHAFSGNANPNFNDGVVGANLGGNGRGRGRITPFDGDGNGEPDSIGRTAGGGTLSRCSDFLPGDILDIVSCVGGASGFIEDPRIEAGAKENYTIVVTFGNGQKVTVELYQDDISPPGIAQVFITSSPNRSFGARLSTSTGTDGAVLGFDVEFAITNVNNAVTDSCARLRQQIVARTGSLTDGPDQGEDFNVAICVYDLPKGLVMTKQCPATNAAPGSLLVFTGSVQNTGQLDIVNLTIVNDQPVPNTIVLGNITLLPGQTRLFTNSYLVPANYTNCTITDTLTAIGQVCGSNVTATATAACPVALLGPSLPWAKFLPSGAFQLTFRNPCQSNFTLLAATNLTNPPQIWTVLQPVTSLGCGLYQYTDTNAPNFPYRFYQLRCP